MEYILVHKDISDCEIEISDASFSIENVSKIYNPEHIPLGLSENEKINLRKFTKDLLHFNIFLYKLLIYFSLCGIFII